MGSLKDEMKGLREDHQPCEKDDGGELPGSSDGNTMLEGCQTNTSNKSATEGGYQPKVHFNANDAEESNVDPVSEDQVLSGGGGDNSDQSHSVRVKDCTQADVAPMTQQPGADKTTAATHNDTTISTELTKNGDTGIQMGNNNHKNKDQDREKEAENQNILVSVPSTSNPSDPHSPAPEGQHHMRTQVSLEVVQCHSAATSPMTPPEGGHSFFFPNSFGRSGDVGTDTKDAELQVGKRVEFCSVATSPMTPKTPSTTAFPELIGRETVQTEEKMKKSEVPGKRGQQESFTATKSSSEAKSEITGALQFTTAKEMTEVLNSSASPESSSSCPAAGFIDSQVIRDGIDHQCKQQRMGSMDQDITILVTHHGNSEEEDEDQIDSSLCTIEPEMVKIDEYEELGDNSKDMKGEVRKEKMSTEAGDPVQDIWSTNLPQTKIKTETVSVSNDHPKTDTNSQDGANKDACEEVKDVSMTKPPVPESPAPFGCHNMRTQVSLEVVQCQSVATSPMTPPEGDHAFCFPSSFGKCGAAGTESKDSELQVDKPVEFRSVGTAPMTPRTPTVTVFPNVIKEVSQDEKIVEVERDNMEQMSSESAEEKDGEEVEAAEEENAEERNGEERGEDKCEEPVQEVNWDEKGMTWEVYGAVVEVAVLGSAIQKHLEKQVKKQKRQPSLPPPPPLNPSATPLTSEPAQGGSGKGRAGKRAERDGKVSRRRRNPFRLLMENMQQPHCCSRAHTTE